MPPKCQWASRGTEQYSSHVCVATTRLARNNELPRDLRSLGVDCAWLAVPSGNRHCRCCILLAYRMSVSSQGTKGGFCGPPLPITRACPEKGGSDRSGEGVGVLPAVVRNRGGVQELDGGPGQPPDPPSKAASWHPFSSPSWPTVCTSP